MRRIALKRAAVVAAFVACGCGQIAWAEDKPANLHHVKPAPAATPAAPQSIYDWNGFYVGVNNGAIEGSYDALTSTAVNPTYLFRPKDVAAVNAAGVQNLKHSGFSGGLQAGYNWQSGRVVFGLEGDLDFLHLNAAANSGAVRYPGGGSGFGPTVHGVFFPYNQAVISSYANANWLATVRPRLGVTVSNWLFYATGGLALTQLQGQMLFTDGNAPDAALGLEQQGNVNTLRAGYSAGGGVEAGLTDRLSLKAEYLFLDFGRVHAHEVDNDFALFTPVVTQNFTQSLDLRASLLRVGLNYRFGVADPTAPGSGLWMQYRGPEAPAAAFEASNWEFDVGTRVWLSSGTIGAPQPLLDLGPLPSFINSRLTYEKLNGVSGETFARVDHSSGLFVKGFIGAGGITSGTLVDEDFPGFGGAYSNTLSSVTGHFGYATIDAGYSFLRTPTAKLGAFVGYNFYTQHANGVGCNQVADDTTCGGFDPTFLGLAEDDRFDSLRLGVTANYMLTDRVKFTADAAYLPWVSFSGQDDHNARQLLLPEAGSPGDGVMLEANLDYAVTNNWNVGIGGRYWAWNMHNGTEFFDFLGLTPPTQPQLGRFTAERYGFFLQSDYHWGNAMPQSASGGTSAEVAQKMPMNWSGIFIGGHVGGGFSNETWSDPFGPTPRAGLINVAGFGDTIHNTGPLAGVQAGANWQTGHLVLGIEGEWTSTDLRGENTCFSGLGGLNCQHVINAIATVAGRAGFAWDRSLLYAKGGVAWSNSTYTVLGETAARNLGLGNTTLTSDGWLAGAGVEYAITNHWATFFEYDCIGIGSVTVPFPTVALVRAQNIAVKQSIDTLKLGVNYKFDWAGAALPR
jgi:opacity protein-like surface antigen